jgi:hypothetical protein
MSDIYIRHGNHWRMAQRRLPEPPSPSRTTSQEGEGAEDFGLPFSREAEEATLEVGVSVLI